MTVSQVGTHTVEITGDVVHVCWVGVVDLPSAKAVYQLIDDVFVRYGRCFIAMDVRDSDLPSPEARKWAADWILRHDSPLVLFAFHGLSPIKKALAQMQIHAIRLLGKKLFSGAYFGSRAEADAWLAEMRRKLLPAAPAT